MRGEVPWKRRSASWRETTSWRAPRRGGARGTCRAPFGPGRKHNANFLLRAGDRRRFVLRINCASQLGLADQIGYEYGALRVLAPSGRTPEPLYVDGTRRRIGRGVLVESFVEGPWIDLRDPRQVREAARALADVHSVAAPPDGALPSPGGSAARPAGKLPEALRRLSGKRSCRGSGSGRGGRAARLGPAGRRRGPGGVDGRAFPRPQHRGGAVPFPHRCRGTRLNRRLGEAGARGGGAGCRLLPFP